jgi:two-component system, OmpR family, response regulator RegX3
MSRVLVVDDEEAIRDAVAYSLRAEGLEVEVREDGSSAVEAVAAENFDVVLLDVMLPDISGVEVARRVRARSNVPILMLTARDTEADLVLGFEVGADDYVPKPFSMRELVSRVRAILRRRELDRAQTDRRLRVGDLVLDPVRHEATVNGRVVSLTPVEYRLLSVLTGADRPFTRRELLEAAWDTTFIADERSCDVHISNLRRKIEDDPSEPRRILTVRGVGYQLHRP